MRSRPAAGGGRWIDVDPQRIVTWLDRFAERHGALTVTPGTSVVAFAAADGSVADCHVPFPPLEEAGEAAPQTAARVLADHALVARRLGVLLVRLGGYAAGVFCGNDLLVSKVGARPVHGRSAAGGWSQRRFARRRDNQAREALRAAADVAERILVRRAEELDAVVLGGDYRAVRALRDDPRLHRIFELAVDPFLTVSDPKLVVLREAPRRARVIRVHLVDADAAHGGVSPARPRSG